MKIYKIILGILSVVVLVTAIFFHIKRDKQSISPEKYNVVIIVSDALRFDVLGCYGGEAKTPNIDWLARNGMLFENAYSTAPATAPSSISISTGNYSRSYVVIDDKKWKMNPINKYLFQVNNKEKMLPKKLKEIGYDLKMDIENEMAVKSNNFKDFDEFRKIGQMNIEEINVVENTIGIENIGWNKDRHLSSNYDRLYDLLYYLLTVPDKQNFFLLKWIFDPHAPYNPPKKFKNRIPLDSSKLAKKLSFYSTTYKRHVWQAAVSKNEFSDYDYFYTRALYKAEVESVDERIGFILKALRLRGFLNNTFIVFTSDHGELLGEHRKMGHANGFYEQLVHIPLIIVGPGIPKGKREKTFISHLDLMPTLKDCLGVKFKNKTQGKSYKALFSGTFLHDRILYFDNIKNPPKSNHDALLMNNYKLIVEKRGKKDFFKLYQLSNDPDESIDLSVEKHKIAMKLFQIISNLRRKNEVRQKQNLKRLDKDIDLERIMKQKTEILKSLGYIE